MRFSQLLAKTLREESKDAELKSHDLLLRAGYIRQLGAGIFSYLHLAHRSLNKIKNIMREEMDAIGGVEISMPFVHPADVWKKTNRWYEIDDSLARFQDRTERDMVLAMTHEEVVADIASTEVKSYKHMPLLVYQIQDKFRDEARSRGGLIRVREFTMKDSYSLDKDWESLEKQYINHYDAYFRIFGRADLPVEAILSDTGMMGGKVAHEFMYITPIGEDTIFICEKTGYRANKEVATFRKTYTEDAPKDLEKVETPQTKTIEDLAKLLKIEASQTAKAVFFMGTFEEEEKLVFAVVRGDMEANAIKIQKLVKAKALRPAEENEIKAVGAVPGFASPIGIQTEKAIVIIDDLVVKTNNLVAGANEADYHYLNTCFDRDYKADIVGDIVSAFEGAFAPNSSEEENTDEYKLKAVRGVEVGNIFQLGVKYTKGLDATFMNENGKPEPIIMGSYGIGVGRLLACVIEEHNDEKGLKLPITIAPFQVHLVALLDNDEIKQLAAETYQNLKQAGIEVLFDDRDKKMAGPGVKFSDADLMGIPIRLTLSKRSLQNGGIELKLRREEESQMFSPEEIVNIIQEKIQSLYQEIDEKVQQLPTWES